MVDRCPVPTARGTPCRGRVLPGRPYCLAHDPALAGRRAERIGRDHRTAHDVGPVTGMHPLTVGCVWACIHADNAAKVVLIICRDGRLTLRPRRHTALHAPV
jgi:hypothetical protein